MHAHQKEEEEEEHQGPSKSSRVDSSQGTYEKQKTEAEDGKLLFNLEEVSPWRNLQLILLLQNKHIDLPTSVFFSLSVSFLLISRRTVVIYANSIRSILKLFDKIVQMSGTVWGFLFIICLKG